MSRALRRLPPAPRERRLARREFRLRAIAPLLLSACTALGGDPGAAPAPPAGPSADARPPTPPAPPTTAPNPPPAPAPPTLITDAECLAKGGQIWTEQTWAHLDRRRDPDHTPAPFRVCHVPSPKNGAACTGEADCAGGRCWCTGPLDRPDPQRDPALAALDGSPATGRCDDEPIPSGEWRCLVVDGKAVLHGIIVD